MTDKKDKRMNELQRLALKAINSGRNVFLTGSGGVGKSEVIKKFIKHTEKNIIICAPTGIAANLINGITVHKLLQAPIGPIAPYYRPAAENQIMEAVDVIIIDEISMLRFDLFKYLVKTIHYYEMLRHCRIQLIVVGDMYQLPPIINKRDWSTLRKLCGDFGKGFPFQTKEWEQCQFEMIELTEQMRQSESEFITYLNRLRIGDITCINYFNEKTAETPNRGITLCPTRACAATINEEKMKELSGKSRPYDASTDGDYDPLMKPTDDVLKLKVGARVMTLRNDKEGRFQNGSLGTVVAMYTNSITIRFDNGNVANAGYCEWNNYDYEVNEFGLLIPKVIGTFRQLCVQLAYAITIHKSQGQTFEEVNIKPECFAEGQLYVALSRAKHLSGLHIDGEIKEQNVRTCREVMQFYQAMRNGGISAEEGGGDHDEKEIA